MTNTVFNPILKGFNPDPSVIRVNGDYYIATSTFEWFPGVQIHHSTDLKHWKLLTRPLSRISQLDLKGIPDSCGVWAPCLSYHDGVFYLVYSVVRSFSGVWKDAPNYLITASDIQGEWSDPVFLNASGFDGSLFHDDNGQKWFTSVIIDHRKGKMFGGILLQEYDGVSRKLSGQQYNIFQGTSIGKTEAPHIYKKDGYYYLVTAEGGTEYGHAVTVARSRNMKGPYEVHPDNPIITSRDHPDYPLQKAGHADFVQTQSGEWFCVFLVGRPLTRLGACVLGRETAIEQISWPEGEWLQLSHKTTLPRLEITVPSLPPSKPNHATMKDDFDGEELNIHFQSLRIPVEELWCSLSKKKGFLTLYGQESLSSLHQQSMIARRLQSFQSHTTVCVDFQPESFQQMAGLICYYNTANFHYLHVSATDLKKRCLQIITFNHYRQTEVIETPVIIHQEGFIYLKAIIRFSKLQFYYGEDGHEWKQIGGVLDTNILSDDYIRERGDFYSPAFTGTFVGMCCQDLTGNRHPAYFDWFAYEDIGDVSSPSNIKNASVCQSSLK